MQQRAFHISRIRACLSNIEAYFDNVYVLQGKNFIDIDDFCRVEFSIENNYSEIIVKNIYFIPPVLPNLQFSSSEYKHL